MSDNRNVNEHETPAPQADETGARSSDTRHTRRRNAIGASNLGAFVLLAAALGVVFVAADYLKDSDGDGLPDHVEESGWATSNGSVYVTDPRGPLPNDGHCSDDLQEVRPRGPAVSHFGTTLVP